MWYSISSMISGLLIQLKILTVIADRPAGTFNRFGATQGVEKT